MLELSRQALLENNEGAVERVIELEYEPVNPLCAKLESFINELMQDGLTKKQIRRGTHVKELVSDVERVSDLTEDLVRIVQKEGNISEVLDKRSISKLDALFQQTHRIYKLALQAVRDGDREMAQLACNLEDEMDRMYWKARKKETKRLKAGKVSAIADLIYMELLRSLEHISDHADSIGMSVIRGSCGNRQSSSCPE
jgi:phosphate transport system protein